MTADGGESQKGGEGGGAGTGKGGRRGLGTGKGWKVSVAESARGRCCGRGGWRDRQGLGGAGLKDQFILSRSGMIQFSFSKAHSGGCAASGL